jgi:hypothetical protein
MGLVGIGRPFPQARNVSSRLFFRLKVSGDYRRLARLGPLDGKRSISMADDAVRGFHRPSIAPPSGTASELALPRARPAIATMGFKDRSLRSGTTKSYTLWGAVGHFSGCDIPGA